MLRLKDKEANCDNHDDNMYDNYDKITVAKK